MYTVVIVEPHPLFRLGLRQLLSDAAPQSAIEGHDYSSLEEPIGPASEKCDLLLLSLSSSRCSERLTEAAVKRFSPVRILLVADADDMPSLTPNLPACVAGSVTKEAPPEILQASVRLVLAGGSCFPARLLSQHAADKIMPLPPPSLQAGHNRYEPANWTPRTTGAPAGASSMQAPGRPTNNEPIDVEFSAPIKPGSAAHRESQLLGLTPRQYEVLVLLARGYPMKKVGRALNISVATAKAHTETLYQRLDVHNRNAAVYAAVSRGATLGWANMMGLPAGEPQP